MAKRNLEERLSRAAELTPDIKDRIERAQTLIHAHPIPDAMAATLAENHPNGGTYMEVPVELIDHNPFNARRIYRPTRVSELAASIGAHGQEVPGIATVRNGRYILAAGHYRHRAITVAGVPKMKLMVYEGLTDKDLFAFSFRENSEREGQSALDNALCWRDLLDKGLYSSETELAEVTGISLPNINKTLKILQLDENILEVIKEEPTAFALSALYELALLEQEAGQDVAFKMALLLRSDEAGRKDVQEARARYANQKERKRKITSRPYSIEREGLTGSLKIFPASGRVTLDVVFEDPAEREKVLEELKERFGISE